MQSLRYSFKEEVSHNPDVVRVSFSKEKETEVLKLPSGQKSIVIGIEKPEKITRRKLILLFRRIISLAKAHKIKRLAITFNDFLFSNIDDSRKDVAELAAANFEMANFEFVKYKTPSSDGWNFVEEIIVVGGKHRDVEEGFKRGRIVGEVVNAMRELANTPGGEMTPPLFAEAAKKAAHGTRVKVRVLGVSEMKKLNMGGILGVGKGSEAEPRFIIMEYLTGAKGEKPIVLVGKGITFDTGGLNIKPGMSMEEMHMDMSGGAAVIWAIVAASRLGIKRNIVGLIPAAENMPSGRSYRMHDVLYTMNGKTIEIGHTDAEGRVVLADALEYAKKYKPQIVIDIATLTGSAMSALGQHASAIFATDEKLERMMRELGEESGDYVWPFPLWEEYEDMVKGTFADVTNSGKSRYGGAIEGAVFLWQFIKGSTDKEQIPWVHIDMAPRISAREGEYLAKGSAGAPLRLLIKFLENT